jgi:ribonuclease HII
VRKIKKDKENVWTIGIDEVGRGPLAGPITLCAVCIETKNKPRVEKALSGFKDSKQLSDSERRTWLKKINVLKKEGRLTYAVSSTSNRMIDLKGLTYAANQAINRCLTKLGVDPHSTCILLDGGLKAPKQYQNQQTIIKGDEKESLIAAASIVAKIRRDDLMTRHHIRYPKYGFDVHKGYGTKMHRTAIKKHGLSPLHRKTFCKSINQNAK